MGRSHAAALKVDSGGERERVRRHEEELVIRFPEVVVWNCKQGGEREQERPSFGTLVHHVVLALPRALLHGRAHVSLLEVD